jgi:hypothetical protein
VIARELLAPDNFPISKTSSLLLIGTVILVALSIVYALGCPAEVKNFSSIEWRYAFGRSLVHYWPRSWRQPWVRALCATLDLLGAALLVPIAFFKLYAAAIYAWQFGA